MSNFGTGPDFNPLAELRRGPVVRPDEVRGMLGNSPTTPPTRKFYVVDTHGTTDFVWEIDGYRQRSPDGELWLLHLICPKCDRALTIRSDRKAVEVGDEYLEVEQFACSWAGDFGSLTCGFSAGIVRPRERVIVTDQGPRQLDGMFRRR